MFSTRDTFFIGISLIFTQEVFPAFVIVAAHVSFTTSQKSSTLLVSSIVPLGAVTPEPGTYCWLRVDQRLPQAASSFSVQMDCLGCRLGLAPCHSTGSCWDFLFSCLTQLARRQMLHQRRPTGNAFCR